MLLLDGTSMNPCAMRHLLRTCSGVLLLGCRTQVADVHRFLPGFATRIPDGTSIAALTCSVPGLEKMHKGVNVEFLIAATRFAVGDSVKVLHCPKA